MTEKTKDLLYLLHALVIWAGSIWQIVYVYTSKSAEDITLVWVCALLISELTALPRACGSQFGVWKICHIVGAFLIAILVVGVLLYG